MSINDDSLCFNELNVEELNNEINLEEIKNGDPKFWEKKVYVYIQKGINGRRRFGRVQISAEEVVGELWERLCGRNGVLRGNLNEFNPENDSLEGWIIEQAERTIDLLEKNEKKSKVKNEISISDANSSEDGKGIEDRLPTKFKGIITELVSKEEEQFTLETGLAIGIDWDITNPFERQDNENKLKKFLFSSNKQAYNIEDFNDINQNPEHPSVFYDDFMSLKKKINEEILK